MAPTIVLIPSSFYSAPLMWNSVVDGLFLAGHHDVVAIDLPSISPPSSLPGKTMIDDANHIRGVIENVINKGRDVVLVMHSYGGIPGTQSLSGITKSQRQNGTGGYEQGKNGSGMGEVVRLVYVTSLLVKEGENSQDSLQPFAAPINYFVPEGEYLTVDPSNGAKTILAGLPQAEGEAWLRKMPGQSMAAFGGRMTSTSHYDIPVTYLKCTADLVVVPEHQQKMIDDFKAVTRSTVDVVEVNSGHCPMITHVERTVDVILKAVKSVS